MRGVTAPWWQGPLIYIYSIYTWFHAPPSSRAQSNKLTRGPPEFFQHFRLQGSSHRRKSAPCPKFYMVWLYRSPIPEGRRGVISSVKNDFYLPSLRVGGGGGRHPVFKSPLGMRRSVQRATVACDGRDHPSMLYNVRMYIYSIHDPFPSEREFLNSLWGLGTE